MQLLTVLTLLLSLLLNTALSAVLFPDEEIQRDKRQEKTEAAPILPCPDGLLYCDDITDYPTNINIADTVVASRLIRNAIFEAKPNLTRETPVLRSNFLKESRACDHRKGTVYPKKAKNIEGQFVFIVNDEKYRQSVEIEQCVSEGDPCQNDSDAPLPTTVCRQKYATYRMYVINQEGRQVYDSFSLPSACLCHHKSSLALGIKNGFNVDFPQLVCPGQEELAVNDLSVESSTTEKASPAGRPQRKNSGIRFQDRKKRQAGNPSDCSNGRDNYCEETGSDSSYPTDAVLEALSENNEINPELFSQLFDQNCKDLKARFFDIDEEQLCSGIPKIIFPRQAKNLKDEWRYIVNIENYTQSVEIEECFNPDFSIDEFESTNTTNSSVLFDNEEIIEEFGSCQYSGSPGNDPELTVCRQLFTSHKLLALSNEGQLVVDSFQLPSACACFYREDFLLTFRSDMNNDTSTEDDSVINFGFQ